MEYPILREAQELFEYTQRLRRDFHCHPELGFMESRTAGIVAGELSTLGLKVKTGVAKTGVVGVLEGSKPGKTILLRFDMDALPIMEENKVPYVSQNPGVMHACGHDGHIAIGLTTARLLKKHQMELAGKVKFVFQPAEEMSGGAERMLAEGILHEPEVDCALALHLWNEKPVGYIAIVPGPLMAEVDSFNIKIKGRGGHGAVPNQTIDPVPAAGQLITALQTIVSRNISPFEPAVVSVTQMIAGETSNVIPSTAELRGTIRTFSPEVRKLVISRMDQITRGIANGFECEGEVEIINRAPAVVNNPHITTLIRQTAAENLDGFHIEDKYQTTISEDMAYILREIPGCYMLLGSSNEVENLNFPHHHPRFNFDEKVLPYGVALMTAAALKILVE
jgi:amidohydrolase